MYVYSVCTADRTGRIHAKASLLNYYSPAPLFVKSSITACENPERYIHDYRQYYSVSLSLSLVSLIYTIEASTLPRRRGCCPMRLFDYLNLESLCIDSAVCIDTAERKGPFFPAAFSFFSGYFFPQRHTRLASLNDNFLFFFSLSIFLFL